MINWADLPFAVTQKLIDDGNLRYDSHHPDHDGAVIAISKKDVPVDQAMLNKVALNAPSGIETTLNLREITGEAFIFDYKDLDHPMADGTRAVYPDMLGWTVSAGAIPNRRIKYDLPNCEAHKGDVDHMCLACDCCMNALAELMNELIACGDWTELPQ